MKFEAALMRRSGSEPPWQKSEKSDNSESLKKLTNPQICENQQIQKSEKYENSEKTKNLKHTNKSEESDKSEKSKQMQGTSTKSEKPANM